MIRLRVFVLFVWACASCAWAQTPPPPYVLDNTEVHSLHANRLQRDYQLFVSLPDSYRQSTRRYPVLFVTDANYGFPLLRSIARRVGDHGRRLDEFILVGISYAQGDTPEYSRRRDYTPTPRGDKDAVSDMPGRAPAFGQAEPFRQFIAEQVFALVEKHYRADMSHKVFAGHSYGALLGAHILLTEPTMFEHYILGSPSLWFDDKVMFRRESEYAASHKDLQAKVFLGAGAFETLKPASADPRYNRTNDMVGDMQRFERVLKSRRFAGLHIHSKVIEDEDHLTVAPAILTRGLLWALGTRH